MTPLNDLYSKANDAKQKGNFAEATQLYKLIIEKYPSKVEAEYAQINITEMEIHKDRHTQDRPPVRDVLKYTIVYGFVGAIIGFVLPFFLNNENPYFVLLIYETVTFGLIIGASLGFLISKYP